jgi:large subunit ribosomal protein L4
VATLKKINLTGKEIGQVQIDDRLVNAEANGQMIKDYIVALRANARQWSACTKTRSEVKHTTKKPHPQKGGGRARQGSLVSPQYRGGGRVFGPKPKFDQHVRINRKERRAAIRFLIAEKIKANRIHIIENLVVDAPKTKTMAQFLKAAGLNRRVLFLGEGNFATIRDGDYEVSFNIGSEAHQNLAKSIRNIPFVEFAIASNISGYDVILAHDIVMTEAALNELNQWLGQ